VLAPRPGFRRRHAARAKHHSGCDRRARNRCRARLDRLQKHLRAPQGWHPLVLGHGSGFVRGSHADRGRVQLKVPERSARVFNANLASQPSARLLQHSIPGSGEVAHSHRISPTVPLSGCTHDASTPEREGGETPLQTLEHLALALQCRSQRVVNVPAASSWTRSAQRRTAYRPGGPAVVH